MTEPAVVETQDLLSQARKQYDLCREAWNDNQDHSRDDLRFARLGEQWPERYKTEREKAGRPCLTFNKMPSFIRQVVNDARQNKPAIKVHPQDSGADPETAQIINGLIRNIETTSDADVAYDTAIEHAVGQGFGFWRVNTAYTCDDAFDQDIVIERVANPFTVYGDPRSTAADSSDWDVAFIVTTMSKDEFKREYPNAENTDWDADFRDCPDWIDGDDVTVAEWWTREKVRGEIVALSDGSVRSTKEVEAKAGELKIEGVTVIGKPRETMIYKVTQRIMTGAEVLKTVEWAGKYIPIVPVYGDEVIDEKGQRHFRSLIRDAKSAQQMLNYWRSTTTELVALAPKAPWVGEQGSMDHPDWDTANTETHSKLEYAKGAPPPQRQPFAGVPAGALQEALNAADDMKSIIGIYDASLGAKSNETSGRAIMARQREGDVSTFHFIDNLSRAIRHGGRIVLDLIPKVYTTARIARILGEDLKPSTVQLAPKDQQTPEMTKMDDQGNVISRAFDVTAGKYDLTVSAGPSFTTRREEAAMQMEGLIQKVPAVGELIGDIYAEALDWPMADKIAERLKPLAMKASGEEQGLPPEIQDQMQQGMQLIQQLQSENQELKAGRAEKVAELQIKQGDQALKAEENEIKRYEAETARIVAMKPPEVRMPPTGVAGTA